MSSYTFQRDFRGFLNFVTFTLVLEQCQAYEKNPLLQLYNGTKQNLSKNSSFLDI